MSTQENNKNNPSELRNTIGIDTAGSVREGEELPTQPLKTWLNENIDFK